jgi:acyl-CoA thioester hydrolase
MTSHPLGRRLPARGAESGERRPPVATRLRVRYAETDRMGVAYYANYLVWFEVGRAEWLRASGSSYRALEEGGLAMPVIEAQCHYRQPLRYDDAFEVRTEGRLLSAVRLQFDYEIVRIDRDGETVAASGHTVHAPLNARGRPCRLPEGLRRLFA